MKTTSLSNFYPYTLALLFFAFFIALGLHPHDRVDWIAEDTPVLIIFIIFIVTFKKFRFSNTAYVIMSVWMFLQTIGGYYTFANVPFNFITNIFDFQRNNFDRVAHFSIGLYAFGAAELLTRKRWTSPLLAGFFGLFFILSIAALYEILEWIYAINMNPEAGLEFLGSQGDIWDAQKDMLSDMIGAIVSLIIFWFLRPDLKTYPSTHKLVP